MASAMSCCWAPSWRLRSSRCRSSSCACTRRRRDARRSSMVARSSSVSRTLRRTSPAWEARCCSSLSSAADIGSFLGLWTVSAPSSSSPCRTAAERVAANAGSRPPSASGTAAGGADPGGHVTRGRSCAPTRVQTSTRVAPTAPARTDAIRSSATPKSTSPAMSCAKSARTWYGVGPLPVDDAVCEELGPAAAGWNNTAIATAAATVSTGPPQSPARVPIPPRCRHTSP
jgi:hypothetical protein